MTDPTSEPSRNQYYAELRPHSLAALWRSLHSLVPNFPQSAFQPALWRYADIRPLLLRSGEVISAEEAVRRVLILENPAASGSASITSTLYSGLQLILPGEVAPAHRHTQSAFRLIIEGSGAFTTVGGERFPMSPGDLVLTPSWEWHDHGNAGTEPVVWLDGLDIPLIRSLEAGFAESANATQQPIMTPAGTNLLTWGAGLRIPAEQDRPFRRVERFMYPYAIWRPALDSLARSGSADASGVFSLEFTNPVDGGTIMPTMSGFCHLLPAGRTTQTVRRTDGRVFHVVEGTGRIRSGDFTAAVTARDTFVVPPWHPLQISADSPLVLFSYSDRATQERLGIWRADTVTAA